MRMIALLAVLTATSLVFCASAAWAQWNPQWNQKLTLTFDHPVAIPGRVLSPGTYVFELGLGDTSQNENVVRVYDKQRNHLYGMFLTVPDHRLTQSNQPILEFEQSGPGKPDAVYAWFYPNDHTGHEFVYPKSEATRLARENRRPVASMPDEASTYTSGGDEASVQGLTRAHVTAVTPEGHQVETLMVFGMPAH
jgi:hypothetical protein